MIRRLVQSIGIFIWQRPRYSKQLETLLNNHLPLAVCRAHTNAILGSLVNHNQNSLVPFRDLKIRVFSSLGKQACNISYHYTHHWLIEKGIIIPVKRHNKLCYSLAPKYRVA